MSTFTCPVEGCDFGEQTDRSESSVRSHINASRDDDHDDKETLRDRLAQQRPTPDDLGDHPGEGEEEGGASGNNPRKQPPTDSPASESTAKGEEAPSEQAESAESEPTESGSDMATDDEYQQQQANRGGESPDATDDGEHPDKGAEGAAQGAAAAATGAGVAGSVAGFHPLVIAAVALLALLLVSTLTAEGGKGEEGPSEQAQTPDPGAVEPPGQGPTGGGLRGGSE